MKVNVNELKNYVGEEIVFSGFIDAIRDKKWVMFVILRDATGKVQMTIEKSDENNKCETTIHSYIVAIRFNSQIYKKNKNNHPFKEEYCLGEIQRG